MRSCLKQRGSTLIEAGIFLAIVGVLGTMVGMVVSRVDDRQLPEVIQQAEQIAFYAEAYRNMALGGTAVGSSGERIHTYNDLPAGTPVSTLNTALGTGLPGTTLYGTPFTVQADGSGPARVSFRVPFVMPDTYLESTVVGSNTTLTVRARPMISRANGRAIYMKRHFFKEATR